MSAESSSVTQADSLPVETFDWGTLQWLCDDRLLPGSAMTLGLCRIRAGARNPLHVHPNCEEVLTMLSGTGTHLLDDESIELRPGSTIRIPVGVRHNLANAGTEPIVCLIAFSSGRRETVFLE